MPDRPPDPKLAALLDAAVQETREKLLRELADTDLGSLTLDQIEALTAQIGAELERTFQRRLLQERTRGPRDNTIDCGCGQVARYRKLLTRVLTTRHGEVRLSRPYYHCAACQRGFCPLDVSLGLDGGSTTTQVRLWSAELAAHLPFEVAQGVLARLTGVRVGASTVERTAIAIGTALQQAPPGTRGGGAAAAGMLRQPKRLYVSMDGKLVPLRDAWKRDGSRGALVCRWGECKSAVIYEAKPGPDGDAGVAHCAYLATLGDCAQFEPQVAALARVQGATRARECIVLADGAPWIWQIAAAQFPRAVQILDFYHATQHLYTVAQACCGEGGPAVKAWVAARQQELQRDQVGAVLLAIAAWKPKSREGKQLRHREFRYFRQNAERLRYGTFQRRGYHISSGVMEATCKHVVGQRLDQAGMHWRPEVAEAIVTLRAALLSTQPPDLRPYCHFTTRLPPT